MIMDRPLKLVLNDVFAMIAGFVLWAGMLYGIYYGFKKFFVEEIKFDFLSIASLSILSIEGLFIALLFIGAFLAGSGEFIYSIIKKESK